MPEHLRALVVIIFMATLVFYFARKPALDIIPQEDFTRRRNAWYALTACAFFSFDFWIYVFLAAFCLLQARTRETNHTALYLSLLFVVPVAGRDIPGFGVINYVFSLNHIRLLELFILVPALFSLSRVANIVPFGRLAPDKWLAGYIFLIIALKVRDSNITGIFRFGFYQALDVILPYYVISRSLRTLENFRAAILGFVIGATIMAVLSMFEFTKHWLLYAALVRSLGIEWDYLGYLGRSGGLRSIVSTGHPIALGYALMIGLGFLMYLTNTVERLTAKRIATVTLLGGLFATLSRGPWLGAAIQFISFSAFGPNRSRLLVQYGFLTACALTVLALIPGGQWIFKLMTFGGNDTTVTYRQQIMENSWVVVQRKPLFGSANFLDEPEMMELVQGEGIIDIVNSYAAIALSSGLIGLALFAGFWISIIVKLLSERRRALRHNAERELLLRSLLASVVATLVVILTTSSITIVPVIYWALAGMAVAAAYGMTSEPSQETSTDGRSLL